MWVGQAARGAAEDHRAVYVEGGFDLVSSSNSLSGLPGPTRVWASARSGLILRDARGGRLLLAAQVSCGMLSALFIASVALMASTTCGAVQSSGTANSVPVSR